MRVRLWWPMVAMLVACSGPKESSTFRDLPEHFARDSEYILSSYTPGTWTSSDESVVTTRATWIESGRYHAQLAFRSPGSVVLSFLPDDDDEPEVESEEIEVADVLEAQAATANGSFVDGDTIIVGGSVTMYMDYFDTQGNELAGGTLLSTDSAEVEIIEEVISLDSFRLVAQGRGDHTAAVAVDGFGDLNIAYESVEVQDLDIVLDAASIADNGRCEVALQVATTAADPVLGWWPLVRWQVNGEMLSTYSGGIFSCRPGDDSIRAVLLGVTTSAVSCSCASP